MENSQTDCEIDIKDLIKNTMRRPLSRPCCIYKAHLLRDVDSAAFTPKLVSIGPLHHFDEHLKGMKETKVKYLKQFLQHAAKTEELLPEKLEEKLEFLGWKKVISDPIETEDDDFTFLGKFLSMLKSLENDIRSSYADNLNDIASGEFLKIILVDAAFIIELFLRLHFQSIGDPLLSRGYLLMFIKSDLWLLENQLPFFVLQQLYNSAFGSYIPDIYPPFLELSCKFFSKYNTQGKDIKREVHHFTDLLRVFFLPSSEDHIDKCGDDNQMKPSNDGNFDEEKELISQYVPLRDHLPNVSELHAAGVKLRASKSKCLLDINFSEGILEIPSLRLMAETMSLFRNLIALEQYHYLQEPFISDYFTFMDYLIDTSRDVDLLVERTIIKHRLGSNNEVARSFNSLCIYISKGYINRRYFGHIKELNEYHNQPWHRWKATLYRQYFSTPWRSASTIAAIILLVLTLAQTILATFTL